MKTKYIVISCQLISLLALKNDVKAQINIYREAIPNGNIKLVHKEAKGNKNIAQLGFSGLFLFYKTFVSSQDQAVCTFTPSCSEFGILAVKRFGMIKGGVMTMDRLTRCNGLSPQNYEVNKKSLLLIDEPGYVKQIPIVSVDK
jgi:uncharacterized protein